MHNCIEKLEMSDKNTLSKWENSEDSYSTRIIYFQDTFD